LIKLLRGTGQPSQPLITPPSALKHAIFGPCDRHPFELMLESILQNPASAVASTIPLNTLSDWENRDEVNRIGSMISIDGGIHLAFSINQLDAEWHVQASTIADASLFYVLRNDSLGQVCS
jgi:hypothetical protein